ncbi:unnamed protein product [Adineta ricciae]|uniref:Uncharacterized protein n=1 Tax=Adineta ricciae TaxID=249248 RepID=A0A815W691_ADIRI|nr:unnamed protein product [Adineta ricciae]CAF1580897.1 unnamed protein product [Adineta ricciae]
MLSNGRILVTGELNVNTNLNSVELYDLSAGNWITTTNMNIERSQHTASILANRKILVAGDYNGNSSINTAELY